MLLILSFVHVYVNRVTENAYNGKMERNNYDGTEARRKK
jgi:hypothetical protein